MIIESAFYLRIAGNISGIRAIIDGNESFIPMVPGNRHYDEIMQMVESGQLIIAEEVTQ